MKRRVKIIILAIVIAIIGIVGFIGFGLYTMQVEDHYGNLQEIYYKSENGDVIVNKTTSQFGIIKKNWKRIIIRTQSKDSADLYNWVYQNGTESKVEIYRLKGRETKLNEITYLELISRIENSDFKLIIKN